MRKDPEYFRERKALRVYVKLMATGKDSAAQRILDKHPEIRKDLGGVSIFDFSYYHLIYSRKK